MTEASSYSVKIETGSRSGNVYYREGDALLTFYWEYLVGDHVAYIQGPHGEDWDARLPWAAERKEEILHRITAEVLQGPGKGCHAVFDFPETIIYFDKIGS